MVLIIFCMCFSEEEEDNIANNSKADTKSVDLDVPPVVNHYYYFPQNGNVNLQVGNDNNMYMGGAPTDSPPSPDDYGQPVYNPDYPVGNYNSKHTVV